MSKYVGQAIKRVEDHRFITGTGQYTDDIVLPRMTHAFIVRSQVAHARILHVDTSSAKEAPGVLAVYTGEDVKEVNGVPCGWQVNFTGGEAMREPKHPLLVHDKVRHVGDSLAVVIAETKEQAQDAADLIEIELEELPVVVKGSDALAPGAPKVHDELPDNLSFDWALGDKEATDQGIANAHYVTKLNIRNQRLVPNAIEPRSYIGHYDPSRDQYTLYTATQNPHVIRLLMCAFVLGIPEHKVRVVARDVGGGFGSKIYHYTEEALVTWASRQLGRPVKWTAERSEAFVTDAHGRDHETVAEMGFDKDGHITALRVHTNANLGAYLSTFASAVPTYLYGTLLQGQYTTPAIHVTVNGIFTHTTPVDAYRGAGRPEATYLIERLMDNAAAELGIDPAELRLKNFIPPFDGVTQAGYQTQVALQYDSGNYESAMRMALEKIGYADLRKEQAEARKQGRYIGIGFSSYIEACGIAPSAVVGSLGARAGLFESANIRVQPTGKISVYTGSHSHGQGHDTAFAQVVAEHLGVPMEDIEIVHGDTELVPFGMGTYGSRSLAVGGAAIVKALEKVKEKGAKVAAHLLEAAEQDLEFKDGSWTVKGTDKSISFSQVALASYVPHNFPKDLEPGIEFNSFYDPTNFTYPFGTYIAVVEVDIETGQVRVKRFVAIDDVGNVVNPMIVDGQVHGGLAQGIGQALLEGAVYDAEGQLTTGTYLDYAMPRADDLPSFELDRQTTPCPHNPLGSKGAGEAGAIGSPPAIVNAAIDALRPLGVTDLEMPLTPQSVWAAIQNASA